jgi:hypothetical protein
VRSRRWRRLGGSSRLAAARRARSADRSRGRTTWRRSSELIAQHDQLEVLGPGGPAATLWGAKTRSGARAGPCPAPHLRHGLSVLGSLRVHRFARLPRTVGDAHASQDEGGIGALRPTPSGVSDPAVLVVGQAAMLYSWIRPPSRSCLVAVGSAGLMRRSAPRPGSGARRLSERCGRCPL